MQIALDNFETPTTNGSFSKVIVYHTLPMRTELLRMSPATFDRYLAPLKDRLHPDANSSTQSSTNRFKDIIPIMTHIKPIDYLPGIILIDTAAIADMPSKANSHPHSLSLTRSWGGPSTPW